MPAAATNIAGLDADAASVNPSAPAISVPTIGVRGPTRSPARAARTTSGSPIAPVSGARPDHPEPAPRPWGPSASDKRVSTVQWPARTHALTIQPARTPRASAYRATRAELVVMLACAAATERQETARSTRGRAQ